MTLAELIAEVYVLTNRPDLAAETTLAVRKATLKLHNADFWPRDLVEVNILFPAALYSGQLDINANFPRFRAVAYMREYNVVHSGRERYLTKLAPDSVLDEYATEQTNLFYVSGASINWKGGAQGLQWNAGAPYNGLTVGYYQNPDIAVATFTSWIAVEQPYAIIELAASDVLEMIGKLDTAARIKQSAIDSLRLLRANYLEGVAR